MHRDLHGEKNDHALVECRWKWRIRAVKPQPAKDFDCIYAQEQDGQGNPTVNQKRLAFIKAIEDKLADLQYDEVDDNTTEMYEKICAAIHHAIDTTLPDCEKRQGVKRKVSERTKDLFERRQKLRGKGNGKHHH